MQEEDKDKTQEPVVSQVPTTPLDVHQQSQTMDDNTRDVEASDCFVLGYN